MCRSPTLDRISDTIAAKYHTSKSDFSKQAVVYFFYKFSCTIKNQLALDIAWIPDQLIISFVLVLHDVIQYFTGVSRTRNITWSHLSFSISGLIVIQTRNSYFQSRIPSYKDFISRIPTHKLGKSRIPREISFPNLATYFFDIPFPNRKIT